VLRGFGAFDEYLSNTSFIASLGKVNSSLFMLST